jgi:hypothetical protein
MHVLWYVNTPSHVKAIINTCGGCCFLLVAILQKKPVSQEIGVCGAIGTTSFMSIYSHQFRSVHLVIDDV